MLGTALRRSIFKDICGNQVKIFYSLLFFFNSISYAEVFEGEAEFIDSTEVTHLCPEGDICINPHWNRYKITAASKLTGDQVELVAAHKHTHVHNTKYVWQFELVESNKHPERCLIEAEWIILNLDVMVDNAKEL